MSVLLIAEHNNTNLKPFTLNAITAASKMNTDVHVLVAGNGCESVSKELSTVPLVKKVLLCESPNYQNYLPENLAPLVTKLSEKSCLCSQSLIMSSASQSFPFIVFNSLYRLSGTLVPELSRTSCKSASRNSR